MSDIVCPRCGAKGNENCSTVRGNDHAARRRAEIAALVARKPADSGRRVRVHAHPLGEPCPPSCAHSSGDPS